MKRSEYELVGWRASTRAPSRSIEPLVWPAGIVTVWPLASVKLRSELGATEPGPPDRVTRSEERRVGKEGGSGGGRVAVNKTLSWRIVVVTGSWLTTRLACSWPP